MPNSSHESSAFGHAAAAFCGANANVFAGRACTLAKVDHSRTGVKHREIGCSFAGAGGGTSSAVAHTFHDGATAMANVTTGAGVVRSRVCA